MAIADIERFKVIDVNTHVSEAEDLWTSRVSVKKWGEMVPFVVPVEEAEQYSQAERPAWQVHGPGERVWIFAGEMAWGVGVAAMTGWKESFPNHPPTLDDAIPAASEPKSRLKYMDEEGIHAQVIFPNIGGFGSARFVKLKEPELMYECVKAYNDWLSEFCSVNPKRLIALAAMPFWDVDLCVEEIDRVAKLGHRGIVWGGHTDTYGLPALPDPHWDKVWNAAQDHELSINFHIDGGAGRHSQPWSGFREMPRTTMTRSCPNSMLDNTQHITDAILGGICYRFPKLNFIAVESGVGWIPFLLEMLDWNWQQQEARIEHQGELGGMLPSEFFRRQCYGCFWAEKSSAKSAMLAYPDNVLFETDFPHAVSMTPSGVPGLGGHARQHIIENFSDVPEDILQKVLHGNAAKLFKLD